MSNLPETQRYVLSQIIDRDEYGKVSPIAKFNQGTIRALAKKGYITIKHNCAYATNEGRQALNPVQADEQPEATPADPIDAPESENVVDDTPVAETNVLDTLTDEERKMFIRTAHSTGLYGKDRQGWCKTSENEEMINKLVNAGLVEIAEVRQPLMGTICKEGAIVLKATKKGLRIEGALFIEQAKNASNYGMIAPWRKHQV